MSQTYTATFIYASCLAIVLCIVVYNNMHAVTYLFHIVESEESAGSAAEDQLLSGQSACMLVCKQNVALAHVISYCIYILDGIFMHRHRHVA